MSEPTTKAGRALLDELDWLMELIVNRASDAEYHHAKDIVLRVRDAMEAVVNAELDRAEAEARGGLDEAARFANAITEYGVHYGDCPYESWNKSLTRCKCGLFQLVKDAEKFLARLAEQPR